MSTTMIISLLVVGFVVAAVFLAATMYQQVAASRSLDTRLDRLTGHGGGSGKSSVLESAGILMPEDTRAWTEKFLPHLPSTQTLFEQADFRMQPANFWLLTAGMALFGAFLPAVLGLPWFLWPIGMISLGVAPIFYVTFLRRRRLDKFANQLGEALELVARALRAGHSLAAGMHVVAEEMPAPVSQEFGRVYEEQNLGLSLEQAMRNLGNRIPNLDLQFFVTAVIIQRTTGGDLAEILDKIGYVIRERIKIKGMVQALTGEGRISGIVLLALPFGLLLMMMKINYDYISLLWKDPLGQQMSAFGIVMMILGALAIRKIINIKI